MGSLYPANEGGPYETRSYRPLFEDRRARNVGDTLVIVLNETTAASKNSNMSVERKASTSSAFNNTSPTFNGPMFSVANIANFAGSGDLKNDGTGASAVNNTFAGTITVTVIEVLSNGNLVVAGEKQVAVSNEEEIIRFAKEFDPQPFHIDEVAATIKPLTPQKARLAALKRQKDNAAKALQAERDRQQVQRAQQQIRRVVTKNP